MPATIHEAVLETRELRREKGELQEIAARFPSSQGIGEPCACKRKSLRRLAACGSKPLLRPASRGFNSRPLASTKKKPPEAVFLNTWWRRRESNPRPQALYRQFYILSTII